MSRGTRCFRKEGGFTVHGIYIGVLGVLGKGWDAYLYVRMHIKAPAVATIVMGVDQFNSREALPACYVLLSSCSLREMISSEPCRQI